MDAENCQKIAPLGWTYVGIEDARYLFQVGDYQKGFKMMECLDEDLTKENLALMARLGVTRSSNE